MTSLYLAYDSELSCTESTLGYDGPYSGYESIEGTSWYTGVYLSPHGLCDSIDSLEEFRVGDIAYVVYAVYSTGSTFGHSEGCLSIVAITHSQELAEQARLHVDTDNEIRIKSSYRGHPKVTGDIHPWPTDLPPLPYKPWDGYFERLQSVQLSSFTVHL